MARTAFRVNIPRGATYTVPAGKTAIFRVSVMREADGGGERVELSIAGVKCARLGGGDGPFTANGGEVIGTIVGNSIYYVDVGLVGFLYDN